VHDDQRNSLSVAQGDDGRVLVRCHAGCNTTAVLAAMDLTWDAIQRYGRGAFGQGSQ
jgi:hypothetical protein